MQQGVQTDITCYVPSMLGVVGQQCCICSLRASWLSLNMRQEKKNVLYIHGCDDLISTEMCGHKIIHVHEIVYNCGLILVASQAFSL